MSSFIWTQEEEKRLIDLCESKLKETSKASYRKELKKLDYESISSNFPNHDAKSCKNQIELIIERVRKVK